MILLKSLLYKSHYRVAAAFFGLLLLISPLLASCGAPAPLQMATIDLGIPQVALNSPVVGPLPDNTQLRVGITFKVSQSVLDKFDRQKIQPGHKSNLEKFANQIGIDDATYQKIKDFFNLKGIELQLSKLRTHLTIDAKAGTFAKLFQTHFVVHTYSGRTFFAQATPPKLPRFLAVYFFAITG